MVNVTTHGDIGLLGATIGGNLDCEKVNTKSLIMERAKITGSLVMIGFKGAINLANAHIGQLYDDKKSWPEKGKLILYGFEYRSFTGHNTPISAKERLEWLKLQPEKPFHPQPI